MVQWQGSFRDGRRGDRLAGGSLTVLQGSAGFCVVSRTALQYPLDSCPISSTEQEEWEGFREPQLPQEVQKSFTETGGRLEGYLGLWGGQRRLLSKGSI